MRKRILTKRRENLNNIIKNKELVIIYAASAPTYQRYFLQDNNFLYFTGLETPDAVFMLFKTGNKMNCKIFLERSIPEMVVWEGAKLPKEAAAKISGIDNIHYLDEFKWHLSNILQNTQKCFINIKISSLESQLKKQHKLADDIKNKHNEIINYNKRR